MPAAIFDLDGTLIDTYDAHFSSWIDVAAEIGHELKEVEFARQFGRTNEPIIRELFELAGKPAPTHDLIVELADRKESNFRSIMEGHFPEMPGATDLVESLHREGWRLAAGTSAPTANADMFKARLGCGALFETIVTGDDVTNGKPDPEVFLLAAKRLDVRPNECVVIEDAAPGVEAARRGGMASVGFSSKGRTREELAAADLVIESLLEVDPSTMRGLLAG